MTLADECRTQMALCERAGLDPATAEVSVMVRGTYNLSRRRRIWPGGPLGECVGWNPSMTHTVIMVNAQQVLDALTPTPARAGDVSDGG